MVSVITPTFRRQHYLPGLYRVYAAQTYSPRELLVYDDSPTASDFMLGLRDPSVHYFHLPPGLSIGAKRNWLVERATGRVIAHFDDDDYYAPSYLSTMIALLDESDVATLAGWFLVDCFSGQLLYWDTRTVMNWHYVVGPGLVPQPINLTRLEDRENWLRYQLYGYGFSFVFTKALLPFVHFEDLDKGEDYRFLTACEAAGKRISFGMDRTGIAVHLIHGDNSSRAFPNHRLPWCLFESLAANLNVRRDVLTATRVLPNPPLQPVVKAQH